MSLDEVPILFTVTHELCTILFLSAGLLRALWLSWESYVAVQSEMESHGILNMKDLLKCFAKDQFPVLRGSGLNSKTPVLKP